MLSIRLISYTSSPDIYWAVMACQAPVSQEALICAINQTQVEVTPGSRLDSDFTC